MDRKVFYDAIRPTLGPLTQANVTGFERYITEAFRRNTELHDFAYILATGWWETGKTMQPVKEAYWLSEDWRRKNLRYYPYYGRGDTQLTWEDNYKLVSQYYGKDFVGNPDLALDPKWSIKIIFDGMEKGWFTGKKLSDYIDNVDEDDKEDLREFANARRIVNGTDRQMEIGKLAIMFERALKLAKYTGSGVSIIQKPPLPTPRPEPGKSSVPLIVAVVAILGSVFAWLSSLPCNLFGVLCGG